MSRNQISMNEIPFAPMLGDTIPPTHNPPAPLPVARPKAHTVVAWRNEGGLDHASFATLETASEFAGKLHFAIYYKWTIQCGREFVARGDIIPPQGYELSEAAYRAFCVSNGLSPRD
jgi:hypothetical protein